MDNPVFNNARWIWENHEPQSDEYAEFTGSFQYTGGKITLRMSCDSNYFVLLNGQLVGFEQYPDYPYYKIYDDIDLTPYCTLGENTLQFTVWYYGITFSSTYFKGDAGLIFEVVCGGEVLLCSSADTDARLSASFRQHYNKVITGQLGLSYCADLNGTPAPWHKAVETDKKVTFTPRPIEHLALLPRTTMNFLLCEDTHYRIDLGRETVGYLDLAFESAVPQRILITYAEHLVDGSVHHEVGGRVFSMEVLARAGENRMLDPMRRLGCRYLEIYCEAPIKPQFLGLRPVEYPVHREAFDTGTPLRQQIYDTCCRTLELCMHDHYEDCPWREQALYAFDSRNQMLCGYYAFKEYRFARASLILMSKGVRPDRLLSICYPASFDVPIASFSMIYPVQVWEYIHYSGDTGILDEVYPVIRGIIDRFVEEVRPDTGLIPRLPYPIWNFYEWVPGCDNGSDIGRGPDAPYHIEYDLLLNCLFLNSLRYFRRLAEMKGDPFSFDEDAMREAIRKTFYDSERGLYRTATDSDFCTRLGNSLAILTGVSTGDEAKAIAEKLKRNEGMTDITLSMLCFLYDALLELDDTNAEFVLSDIEEKYGYMLANDATSFWETIAGFSDFGAAGSLCHGWSALPVYYYHRLLK